jgi:outer membrane protein OmpA-like peptidoglycan-associated protein
MRKKLILLGSFLLFVMVGCASSSYFGVPSKALGVPDQFGQTEAVIASAENSEGAKYCPEKIARAKALAKEGVETYWACRSAEGMDLLSQARNLAKEAESCQPPSRATAPPPRADTTPPTVTSFSIPARSSSLTVPITSFSATDNPGGTGVAGYRVTESVFTPSPSDPYWSTFAPSNYTFATEGTKTLYAWAKDAAGNVSTSLSANVTLTLPSLPPPKPRVEEKVVILASEPKVEEKVVALASEPKEKVIILAFEDVHFDFDKATLTEEAQVILKRNIQVLKANPKAKVRIAGYTSASGTESYNQGLSERRANAVKEYLTKEGVIAPNRLSIIGYGETRPAMYEAAPIDLYSEAAKANMRVLFEIIVE